jgi:hypothetical protein
MALLDGGSLEILQVTPVTAPLSGSAEQPIADEAQLAYRVVDAAGGREAPLARGTLADPRVRRMERAAPGEPLHDVAVATPRGVIALELPAGAALGRLELLAPGERADGAAVLAAAELSVAGHGLPAALYPLQAGPSPLTLDGWPEAARFYGDQDPSNVVNVLFVPDGYGELAQFRRDVEAALRQVLTHPSFRPYADRLNGWVLDDRSVAYRDLFTAQVPNGTIVKFGAPRSQSAASGVSNELFYPVGGGVNGGMLRHTYIEMETSRNSEVTGRVLAHELGHALLNLTDEYDGSSCAPSRLAQGERTKPNATTTLAQATLKWRDLLTAGVPLPTPPRAEYALAVGAFEGAMACSRGVYRPAQTCLMRESSTDHLCPVCARELSRLFLEVDSRLGRPAPAPGAPALTAAAPAVPAPGAPPPGTPAFNTPGPWTPSVAPAGGLVGSSGRLGG